MQTNPISTCFWYDGKAEEAAAWYCSIFKDAAIKTTNSFVTGFEIYGTPLLALNGGSQFRSNASISLFVTTADLDELDKAWGILADEGSILMPLDNYAWGERYGWLQDKYGVSWQFHLENVAPRVIPCLMFCGAQQGRAAQAIDYYTTLFPQALLQDMNHYEPGQTDIDATVVHARFALQNQPFIAMDSGVAQPFSFTEGVSLVVHCDTQEEIDYYWNRFIADGGQESNCGWLKDKFGVSWQIVYSGLGELMSQPDKLQRVAQVLMQMKKLDILQLKNA